MRIQTVALALLVVAATGVAAFAVFRESGRDRRPADLPDVESGPEIGSGRNARLKGRITRGISASSDGFATIEFVEGTNRGRVLTTGNDGGFGAVDL